MREQRINCNCSIPTNQCLNCWAKMDKNANVCPSCGTEYIDFFNQSLTQKRHVVLRLRDPLTRRGVDVLLTPANASAYVRELGYPSDSELYPDKYNSRLCDPVIPSKQFEVGFHVDAEYNDFIMRFVSEGGKDDYE